MKAIISTADEAPLARFADAVWGINIVRSLKDLKGAPPDIVRAFKMVTGTPMPYRCTCCGEEKNETAGGLAVLRTTSPGERNIAIGLCKECLREPDSTKLTTRIYKLVTGKDKPSKDWKELLQ